MIRPSARLLAAPLAVAASCAGPVLAQEQPETFTLPAATPTPSPAPAGPADERAGVTIPPRVQPTVTPEPTASPNPTTSPSPRALATPILQPPAPVVPPTREGIPVSPLSTPDPEPAPTPGSVATIPSGDPLPSATTLPLPGAGVPEAGTPALGASMLPAWWAYAAGGLGALALLLGGLLWWRRKPGVLRIAAPLATPAAADFADEQPRLDLTLEITAATRSVMMFTLEYRLTIANRSERAVTDLNAAVQLACARASAANAPSPGAAQGLARIDRVGPHQARSITGQVQLPLSAIAPLRQGAAPMFIPLVHVTMEGAGLRALDKSFVIGTPSASGTGRVHPILLDQPPGAIAGLVAQPIAIPPVSGPVSAPVPAGA